MKLSILLNGQVIQELDMSILHDMLNPRRGEVWQATVEGAGCAEDFFDWIERQSPRRKELEASKKKHAVMMERMATEPPGPESFPAHVIKRRAT